jgi:hypothetical protein
MLLIVTAVLFVITMPGHEAGTILHKEVQNLMSKNQLLVPPSAPNPSSYIPALTTSTHSSAPPVLGSLQKSTPPPSNNP